LQGSDDPNAERESLRQGVPARPLDFIAGRSRLDFIEHRNAIHPSRLAVSSSSLFVAIFPVNRGDVFSPNFGRIGFGTA